MMKTVARSVCFLAVLGVATVAFGQPTPTPTRTPTVGVSATATRTPTTAISATATRTPTSGVMATATRTPTAGVFVTPTVTAVVGDAPTSTDQCRNEGWRRFTNPRFKNQGDCVSYVASQGRAGGNPKGTPTAVPTPE
jgi:hypothetical protein